MFDLGQNQRCAQLFMRDNVTDTEERKKYERTKYRIHNKYRYTTINRISKKIV